MQLSISCDFDGTITVADTVDAILEAFADPAWQEVEAEWQAGRIGSRECLLEQTKLIRVTPEALDAWLDERKVDPEVPAFFEDCARLRIPVSVVSDGYDRAVRRVLARIGVENVPVIANRLVPAGEDRWAALFPYSVATCGSGVCKCAVVNGPQTLVHIGDGRSDVCVSDMADLVFAKAHLLESRTRRGLDSIAFDSFAEIRAMLPGLAERLPQPAQKIA